ncbi:MAG: hypothetical protein M3126_04985, partial [Candidatus Eremiobacteraeota bacterium]|nr:hypothetical protein [Candidatus Eremiobacteraeota bacterium]
RIKVTGAVASRDLAEFAISSSEIVVHSPVDFNDDETGMTVFSDDAVTPGTRIAVSLRAANHGTGHAHDVVAAFDLPPGLIYTPGSFMIDGQPARDESFRDGAIALGTIPPGRSIEAGLSAMVGVPPEGDYALPIAARLRWKGGERRFARRLTVRATPRFARARNYIEVDRRVAQAEEDIDFYIHLLNDGTAPDRASELRILPGAFVGHVRILDEMGVEVPYDSPIKLGTMEPHVERMVTVRTKIVPPVPDRATVTVGAVLEQRERVIDLGVGSLIVRSRAHVPTQSAGWELKRHEPLRPNETADIVVRFTNDGSDTLRDARAVLDVPADLTIERAHDARREHNTLYFGDIPAKETHEARFTFRLLRAVSGSGSKTIAGVLQGRGISALTFSPLEVATFSQPEFEAGAQLRTSPHELVNAGERIAYDLLLRNTGDGPATLLNVRAIPSNLAVYVPATTTVNGIAVPDDVGTSALWSQRGMALTEIDPGVDVRVCWEMLAVTPLAAGTALDARVMLSWNGDRSHAIAAPTLHIQAAPNLAGDLAVGSISIAQTLARGRSQSAPSSWQAAPETQPEAPESAPHGEPVPVVSEIMPVAQDAFVPAISEIAEVPSVRSEPESHVEPAPMPEAIAEIVERSHASPEGTIVAPSLPTVYVDFGPEKLSRSLRMLEKSDFDGMLPHLFAIRLFFPESIVNAPAEVEKSFRIANRAMQNTLDRLFVRLRIPRYAITSKDLEDRDSRFALRQLVSTVIATGAREGGDGRAAGVVRISGPVDTHDLRKLQSELESAPLGSAVPWQVAAAMLGSTIYRDGDRSTAMGRYRAELISVLGTLHALPLEEFHRVLRDRPNRAVDDALHAVLENLRSAAHIAAE